MGIPIHMHFFIFFQVPPEPPVNIYIKEGYYLTTVRSRVDRASL